MNVSSAVGCPCVVHLLHSTSGLTHSYVASPETHVDVGTIATHFSLQPSSVRFNGHFISRDVHFISGLTWRELLTFFRSRGFNWGSHPLNPVEVQGRPLLQSPDEGPAGSTVNFQNAKRLALESNFIPPSKRIKQAGGSDALSQSLSPCKVKRRVLADEFLPSTPSKRVQHQSNSGPSEAASECPLYECDATCGSKRQRSSDDVCSGKSLWKRMKEVKV